MGHQRNALFTEEGGNKASKMDLDRYSKPHIDTTQCAKFLFTDPTNKKTGFACKNYQKIEREVNLAVFHESMATGLGSHTCHMP